MPPTLEEYVEIYSFHHLQNLKTIDAYACCVQIWTRLMESYLQQRQGGEITCNRVLMVLNASYI